MPVTFHLPRREPSFLPIGSSVLRSLGGVKLVDESQKTEVREAVYPILSKAAKRKLGSGRIPRDDLGYMSIQLLGKLGFAKADLPVLIEVIDTYTSYAAAGLEKSINDPLVQEYIDKSLTSSKFSWSTPAHRLVQKMGSKGKQLPGKLWSKRMITLAAAA